MGERIQDVAHLGCVELFTPKPERTLWYFRDLLGMEVVHREGEAHYLRGYGDYAAATLNVSAAKAPGVGCIAWRAASPEALDRRVAAQNGGEGAQRFRTALGAQLSAAQRQMADSRLSTWKTQNAEGETQ